MVSCSVTGKATSTSSSAGWLVCSEVPRSPRSASLRKRRYCTQTGWSRPSCWRSRASACAVAWSPSSKLRDVARQQVHGNEHHDADAEQHERELQQPLGDVGGHARLSYRAATMTGTDPAAPKPRPRFAGEVEAPLRRG